MIKSYNKLSLSNLCTPILGVPPSFAGSVCSQRSLVLLGQVSFRRCFPPRGCSTQMHPHLDPDCLHFGRVEVRAPKSIPHKHGIWATNVTHWRRFSNPRRRCFNIRRSSDLCVGPSDVYQGVHSEATEFETRCNNLRNMHWYFYNLHSYKPPHHPKTDGYEDVRHGYRMHRLLVSPVRIPVASSCMHQQSH